MMPITPMYEKMKSYFHGDVEKTITWFNTTNPSLGGVKPLDMIRKGRIAKLEKFIDSRLAGHSP